MKKFNLLAQDALQKERLAALRGGGTTTGLVYQKCPCVCAGPVNPSGPIPSDGEVDPNSILTDSLANNSFKSVNNPIIHN